MCPNCERLYRTGGKGWSSVFFFVCRNGHVRANDAIPDRLRMVRLFDEATLNRALRDSRLQRVVRLAIQRRLRKIKSDRP